MSRRTAAALLRDLCGVEAALGSVTACEQAAPGSLPERVPLKRARLQAA